MALERDENRVPVSSGVTDDANLTPTALRIDPTTKRLKVMTVFDGLTVGDGDTIGGTDEGVAVLGGDGTDYQLLTTDSDGHLQVDVLSTVATNVTIADVDTSGTQTNDLLVSLDSEVVLVDATGQGDVPITLDSEQVDISDRAGRDMGQIDVVNTVTVDSTDLDIRDLSESQDGVAIYGSDDGGTTMRLIKTDSGGAIQVDLEVASVDISDINTGGTQTNDLLVSLDGESVAVTNSGLTELASAINASNQMDINIAAQGSDLTIADGGNTITVDGTVSANSTLQTGSNTVGKVYITDGTEDTAVNASNELQVRDDDANTDLDTIAGAVAGSEMQVDVVAALPAGDNNIGNVDIASSVALDVSAATVTVDATDLDIRDLTSVSDSVTAEHGITGIGDGVKTVTTAGTDEALAGSTACKRVTIQAQTDNTGLIAVGASGVDATEATGTGIILEAGDVFELEIDNLADIYIDSTVNGEGVRYVFFT